MNALSVPSCRQGGAGFYTGMLIDGLSRAEGVEATALVSGRVAGELAELAPRAEVSAARDRPLPAGRRAANQVAALRRPWTLDLGYEAESPAADVTHWPIAFMNAPVPKGRRVLTVHDLQHEYFPRFFSRKDRLLRRMRWRPSARAADHVITISQFSRESICERYEIPADRVSVVSLACRGTLETDGNELPESLREERLPWLIYPASPLPAKNHLRLLDAVRLHLDGGGQPLRVVLVGPTMHSWEPILKEISQRRLEAEILLMGHVDEGSLAALYASARGLIFPSLFEGFGLPVLEAMAAGCPIAVSTAGSLPELAEGVGHRFDAADVEGIAAGIGWLLGLSGKERAAQAEAGRKRAGSFSLERMTAETVAAYRRTAGR